MHQMSHSDIRDGLQRALKDHFPMKKGPKGEPMGSSAWIREVFGDHVVFEKDGKTHKMGYSTKNGNFSFDGKPMEVRIVTSYEPVGRRKGFSGMMDAVMKKSEKPEPGEDE